MRTWRRFGRFNLVGAAGIAVQLLVLWGLTAAAGVHYLPATMLAVTAAVAHNFAWHWRWTWADRTRGSRAAARTFVAFAAANGVVSIAGNVGLMSLFVGGAALPPVPANLVAIAATGVVNFWLGDTLVFARGTGLLQRSPLKPPLRSRLQSSITLR